MKKLNDLFKKVLFTFLLLFLCGNVFSQGLSLSSSQTNVSCNGGSNGTITLTVGAGYSPYTFIWSNSATTQNLTGLSAGSYSVTVTDSLGTVDSLLSIAITQPSLLTASINVIQNVSCYGGSNGSAYAVPSGGTAGFTYLWSNSSTGDTAASLNYVGAGYYVTVTDAHGCTTTAHGVITQPTALNITITSLVNVSCNGGNNGSINGVVTGGTVAYSYSWSNGETVMHDTNLVAGTYYLTVTDGNGCTAIDTSVITQPSVLNDSMNFTNISCYGLPTGTATAYPYGGSFPYSYSWSNGPPNTANKTGLSAGVYHVTITDVHGCTKVDSVTISQPGAALTDSVVTRNILCYGGSVDSAWVIASGGTTPYNYLWTGGSLIVTGVNTDTITNVSPAVYTLRVTDNKGCTTTNNVTISQPSALVAYFDAGAGAIKSVLCHGGNTGSATVSALGGTTPYSYLWSNSETGQKDSLLVAGNYRVTVTDAHGCTAVDSVTITEPSVLTLSLSTIMFGSYNIQCNGGSNLITSVVAGGTMAYNYLWNDSSTFSFFNGAVAGTYSLTVTDVNGCVINSSITLTQPSAIIDTISSPLNSYGFNVGCSYNGVCAGDGSINLSVSGGVAGYSYRWFYALPVQNPTGLCAGFYSVNITDSIGCLHSDTITLTAPPPLGAIGDSVHVYSNYANVSCDSCHDGIIYALPALGTSPYSYQWSNQNISTAVFVADTLESISNCGPWGIYYVAVGDVNGCRAVSPPIFLSNAVYSDWRTTGNLGNNAFLGTIDSTDLVIKTNDSTRMTISANGVLTKSGVSVFDTVRVGRIMTNSPDSIIRLGDSTIYIYPYNMIGFSTGLANIPLLNSTTLAGSGSNSIYNGLIIGNPISYPYTPWWNHNITLYMSSPPLASAPNSIAIGFSVNNSVGNNSSTTATNSITMGEFITNSIPNSMMIGFGGTEPTIFVSPSNSSGSGNVGIGLSNPQYKFDVKGTIHACDVEVDLTNGCDFVFENGYKPMPWNELENYYIKNHHLPGIASANEMVSKPMSLSEFNLNLLQKVEEQTIYIVDLHKQLEEQNKRIESLEKLIKK